MTVPCCICVSRTNSGLFLLKVLLEEWIFQVWKEFWIILFDPFIRLMLDVELFDNYNSLVTNFQDQTRGSFDRWNAYILTFWHFDMLREYIYIIRKQVDKALTSNPPSLVNSETNLFGRSGFLINNGWCR